MSTRLQKNAALKKTFWSVAVFYILIAFEFFYMATPFAIYFYSVYGPVLNFINDSPTLGWLSSIFLPHIVIETSSLLLNLHNLLGAILALVGFLAFCFCAGQVYYYKLAHKGVVTGGIYNFIRHPQYLSLAICSFGLLLLWPRYIVILSFTSMLFVYYFLARVEEEECEAKFGRSYLEYKDKTNMFLPFRASLVDRLPDLPTAGWQRYTMILLLYVVASIGAVIVANGLRDWSLNSLYAVYNKNDVYISVAKVETETLRQAIAIAQADTEVQNRLKSVAGAKFINYILPVEWYIPEIPMWPVESAIGGRHYSPSNYDRNLLKIIFTKTVLRTAQAEGKEILLNTVKRTPVIEAEVDLSKRQVVNIKAPPTRLMYENINIPLY
ncbi:MAG: isoprenylcysteine carboxylmethyltransferase family protein [Candidatus Competibacteraceae bacterium]